MDFRDGTLGKVQNALKQEFPDLEMEKIQPFLPFRYLVSGGVSTRSLMPGFTQSLWARLERMLKALMSNLAAFAFISVRRR